MDNIDDIAPPPPVVTDTPAQEDYFSGVVNEVKQVIAPEDAPPPAAKPAAKAEPAPVVEDTPVATETQGGEKDDIDSIEPPANASKAAKDHWDALKITSKNYKAKATAAEQLLTAKEAEHAEKIAEYEAKVAKVAEYEAKQAEFEEAQRELSIARVEGTAEYKNTILKPLEVIGQRAQQIAKANDVGSDSVLDIIAERDFDKQQELLDEILPSLKPSAQLALARMVEDAREIFDKKERIENDYQAAAKEITERQEKETLKSKEASRKEFSSAVEHAASELKKRFPFVSLAEGETADGVFANMLKDAKETDFDAAPAGTKAAAALSTLALVRATKQMQKMDAELKTLKARVAESNSSSPAVSPGSAPPPATDEGDLVGRVESLLGLQRSHNVLVGLGSNG